MPPMEAAPRQHRGGIVPVTFAVRRRGRAGSMRLTVRCSIDPGPPGYSAPHVHGDCPACGPAHPGVKRQTQSTGNGCRGDRFYGDPLRG